MSDDRLNVMLLQIQEVATEIAAFTKDMTPESLQSDLLKERAIGMSLMILADLSGKIASQFPEFAASRTDVPWSKIRAFRNHLAHNYFGLERDILWDTATVSVPELIVALRPSIPPYSGS